MAGFSTLKSGFRSQCFKPFYTFDIYIWNFCFDYWSSCLSYLSIIPPICLKEQHLLSCPSPINPLFPTQSLVLLLSPPLPFIPLQVSSPARAPVFDQALLPSSASIFFSFSFHSFHSFLLSFPPSHFVSFSPELHLFILLLLHRIICSLQSSNCLKIYFKYQVVWWIWSRYVYKPIRE